MTDPKVSVVMSVYNGETFLREAIDSIYPSVLYHWKKQYCRGRFNNEPTEEAALKDRIEKLERLVGRLTLENEFLKRGLQHSLSQSRQNGKSLRGGNTASKMSVAGASL